MGVPFPDPKYTEDAPTTVTTAEEQRIALLELEDSETAALIRRWIEVEARLSPVVRNVVDEIIRRRAAGESLTRDQVVAMQQMAELTALANDEFDSAIDDLEPTIRTHEHAAVEQGNIAARVLIAAVAIDMGRRARVSAGDLEGEALEEFVFGLQDLNATMRILKGERFNPVSMITDVVAAGAFSGFTAETMFNAFMYEGVTQTLSYFSLVMRDLLATRHRNAMTWVYQNAKPSDFGLESALDVNKLGQPDIFTVGRSVLGTRQAGQAATARAEDRLVLGWRRRSRRDFRVCMVCISLDGKLYSTDELLEVHPNERCFMVPVLRGMPIPDWQTGREWLLEQPENVQIELMGRGKYELFRDGQIDFDDFVEYTGERNGVPQVKVRALRDMQPEAATRRGAGGTRRGGRRTQPHREGETRGAAGQRRTNRPQRTEELNPEPPFPLTDDMLARAGGREPVRSALPVNFPTDEQIARAPKIRLGNTGVNTSFAVEIDGKKYFVKKVGTVQGQNEVANYELAEMLGLKGRVPPTRRITMPDGSPGVIAEFAEGAKPIGGLGYDAQKFFWDTTMDPQDRARFQMLEYLNGNTDRHAMNFMINPNTGDFYIIDSGASFGISPFEQDIAYYYVDNITNLNLPNAVPNLGRWMNNTVSTDLLQTIVDQSDQIVALLDTGAGGVTYNPQAIQALRRRLILLARVINHMDVFDLDELTFTELEELLDQLNRIP